MNKKEKSYDAAKMMREIRDKISDETHGMTYAEFKLYTKERLEKKKLKVT